MCFLAQGCLKSASVPISPLGFEGFIKKTLSPGVSLKISSVWQDRKRLRLVYTELLRIKRSIFSILSIVPDTIAESICGNRLQVVQKGMEEYGKIAGDYDRKMGQAGPCNGRSLRGNAFSPAACLSVCTGGISGDSDVSVDKEGGKAHTYWQRISDKRYPFFSGKRGDFASLADCSVGKQSCHVIYGRSGVV